MRCSNFTIRLSSLITVSLAAASLATPQGRPIDWPSQSGDAQRTGWEKVDSRITKDNVKDFQLVLKRKLDNPHSGPYSLTPPVVIGLLISYRGFKELAFVAGSSDNMWAIDADLDRIFWERHFDAASPAATPAGVSSPCASGVISTPGLIPPVNFGVRPRLGAGGPRPPAAPGGPPPVRSGARGMLAGGGFGGPRPAFAISSDGKLHLMNTSTGEDVVPAMPFLPANSHASSLTVAEGVVYTTTSPDCGNSQGGVWALDVNTAESQSGPAVASFSLKGGPVSRYGGLALGTDNTVYVQTGSAASGPGSADPASGKWSNTLLALSPKDLKLKEYFTSPAGSPSTGPLNLNVTTPVVFAYAGRDLIVSAGADGRLYLLDSKSVGGEDHKTALYQTPPVTKPGGGIWGGLSSWQDSDGTRWVLAPVWGAVNPELNAHAGNGDAPHGSVIAFKVEDHEGKAILTPAWVSHDINSPEPPVITGGIVFVLSPGQYASDGRPSGATHATLYALDASNGKEIYSTAGQVTAPGNLTGLTLANGRVYFTTNDSTLYAFGIHLER